MWHKMRSAVRLACNGMLLFGLLTAGPMAAADDPGSKRPVLTDSSAGDADESLKVDDAAEPHPTSTDSLLDLDIDELAKVDVVVPSAVPALDIPVASVSRQESTVGKSPAAVFVITQDMIRRSGATSIPEVLRLAPGLQVARIDSNKWAISSRGFNGQFANKLLVMIDGRTIYTPVFSGVYWDAQGLILPDIERIEVIRGPGGTVWGANAVNGVINIITKDAAATQGVLASSGGGTTDESINALRYGGQIGENGHYRVWGKHFERDGFPGVGNGHDDWRQGRFGFRADWAVDPYDVDHVTLLGGYYQGDSGSVGSFTLPAPPFRLRRAFDTGISGGHVLARWSHQFANDSNLTVQSFYDHAGRDGFDDSQSIDTFDFDLVHRLPRYGRHSVTWGLHYRRIEDEFGLNLPFFFRYTPPRRATDLVGMFVQDEIAVVEDVLSLIVGSKVENNDYTGIEVQPNARLLWSIDERRVAWAAVSRAVRTPSRFEDNTRLVFANIRPVPPTFLAIQGNTGVEAENLLAYELGYRQQVSNRFSWDAALFYNEYTDLIEFESARPTRSASALIIPFVANNVASAETYGVEISGNYEVTPDWRIYGAYTFLQMHLHRDTSATLLDAVDAPEGISPQNQVVLMPSWDLTEEVEFDLIGRYVDELRELNVSHYISLDARLGWNPTENWQLSVVGQNLLQPSHAEFYSENNFAQRVPRGIYAEVLWRY